MQNILKNALIIFGFLFALALLVLGLNELRGVFFTEAGAGLEPIGVSTTGVTSNSAIVNFSTEKEVVSLVTYGSDSNNLSLFSTETQKTTQHTLTLSFLSPSTTYYYKIKMGEQSYDNNGVPWSFTTKSSQQPSQGNIGTQFDNIDPEIFKQKFGTSDTTYDLNRDGIVNSTDYLLYLKKTQ